VSSLIAIAAAPAAHAENVRRALMHPVKAALTAIVTFLKGHILGIVLVGIFCSVTASFIYSWLQSLHTREKISQSATTVPPFHLPPTDVDAPIVRFTDGKRAVINFSVVTRVLDKDAARVVAYAGDREHATEALGPPTEAAIFTLFEKLTYDEASTRRREIEATLLDMLRPRYEAVGITLDSISLKAFTLVDNNK
jgi:hypothetical protein